MPKQFRPGIFDYAGFGYGHFYNADGTKTWCGPSEARDLAKTQGLSTLFKYVDTLPTSWGYTPNPEQYMIETQPPVLKTFRVRIDMLLDAVDETWLQKRIEGETPAQLLVGASDIYVTIQE